MGSNGVKWCDLWGLFLCSGTANFVKLGGAF